MFTAPAVWLTASLFLAGADAESAPPDVAARAVEKALPLLIKGAEGHVGKRSCFACHNQGVPMLAFTTARARGFAVGDEVVTKQVEHILAFFERNRDNFRKGQGTGGQVDTAGYALLTLERGGHKPDATTAAMVEYLLKHDNKFDHWRVWHSASLRGQLPDHHVPGCPCPARLGHT